MRLSLVAIFFFQLISVKAEELDLKTVFSSSEEVIFLTSPTQQTFILTDNQLLKQRPSPLLRLFHDKQKRNKKITAAVLAFPFPFGIVGLHRIYLGCPPYVPVVYIGTLGGVFGALPLIDFFVIVFDKNFENYLNNPQVFMWIK